MYRIIYNIILFLFIFTAVSYAGGTNTYLIVVNVKVMVKETEYVPCTETVKERKKGRWVYVKKEKKCPKEVENWKPIEVKDTFKGDNQKEARKEAIEYYKDKGYKIVKVVSVTKVK